MSRRTELIAALRGLHDFEVSGTSEAPVAYRRRILPNTKLARILFPRAVVTCGGAGGADVLVVRPDGWAYASLVIAIGGCVTELVMPRDTYPRDYPPAAVVIIAATIAGSLLVDLAWTRRLLRAAVR